jgi:hypothetical protein
MDSHLDCRWGALKEELTTVTVAFRRCRVLKSDSREIEGGGITDSSEEFQGLIPPLLMRLRGRREGVRREEEVRDVREVVERVQVASRVRRRRQFPESRSAGPDPLAGSWSITTGRRRVWFLA